MRPRTRKILSLLGLALAFVSSAPAPPATPKADDEIRLLFLYGSEKKTWLEKVTKEFNESGFTIPDGKRIKVVLKDVGSGEMVDELSKKPEEVPEEWRAQLISPAASAFMDQANYRAEEAGLPALIGERQYLVQSPIVVAMWRDTAVKIGWGVKPISWREIFDYARDPVLWQKKINDPKAGPMKFGHTHPDFSNTGLHALFAEVYAALNKFQGLERKDLADRRAEVENYVRQVEDSVVHYGSSTGTLSKKMVAEGRDYLDVAILYENLVIEANKEAKTKNPGLGETPIVAIYPSEGTFLADHPVGLVKRGWVKVEHRQAYDVYSKFLLDAKQQDVAKASGFRTAKDPNPADILRPEFGVDPAEPRVKYLEPPKGSIRGIIASIWTLNKRPADIVLAIDISSTMKGEKIRRVEKAAKVFLGMIREGDNVSTLIFSSEVEWGEKNVKISDEGRERLIKSISGLEANPGTVLYQAVLDSYEFLSTHNPSRNRALVILSDGKDSEMKIRLEDVVRRIKPAPGAKPIYIYTIAYGKDADPSVLEKISKATKGEMFKDGGEGPADDKSIREIFIKIATFF